MDYLRQPPKPPNGSCHKADWKSFGVLPSSQSQRKAVFNRDNGQCKKCGEIKPWHAEHIFPLWLVDRDNYPECLKYWSLDNLETVCVDCHRDKTGKETKDRAKVNRLKNGKKKSKTKWPSRKIPSRPFRRP